MGPLRQAPEDFALPLAGQHAQRVVELGHETRSFAGLIDIIILNSHVFHTTSEKASYLSF